MRARRLRAGIAVAAAVTLAVAGCAESDRDGDSSSSSGDKTLVFGVAGDAKALDPALTSDGESFRVTRQIYETLVRPEEGGAKIVPGLAEKFEPDSSGLKWTFTLKKGVKFQDGEAFNAAAVCYNFDRWYKSTGLMQNPDVTYYWQTIMGGFEKNESADLGESLFKSCKAEGDDKAIIETTKVTSKFPSALALPSFSIASPKALQQYNANQVTGSADDIKYPAFAMEHPVGTGPFKFVKWDTANKTVTLERYDGYWGGKAKLKTLIFKTISDLNARKQALRNNEIQGYDLVAPADVAALKSEGFNVLTRPAFTCRTWR